jgi:hypothetical protein
MSIIARQSTDRTMMIGPVLDADGVAVTDCVIGDFKISKNGAAPAALNGSATLTHRNTGHYSLLAKAADLSDVGQAEIVIDDTVNACPVKEITVVEEAVYDALFAASAAGYQVPIWAAANSTVNLSATTIATLTTYTGNTPQTGDSYAVVNSGTHGNAAIKGYVDDIGAAGAGLTAVPWNAAWDAEVQSEVNDGLVAFSASTLTQAQVTGGAYALDTDANGRVRIVDGTAAGELNTASGAIVQVDQLGAQAKADVNAEVVDALATDTYAEPGQGTPPATAALTTKINWLYTAFRNLKTQTSTEQKLFADDGGTVLAKISVSDDGTTFTSTEAVSGP